MNALQQLLRRNSDVAMVLAVLGVLVVLFVPIPKPLLDFLILANFGFAFLILLLTFYMARPVEFSTFPSLLLLATLFRLSLNVAATRLILAEGDAGKVIGAIGSYVVAGNYVVGLIVFLPFLLIDLVVSSVLMALGMMMMPPTTVALPLKVLMFILVDGWSLVLKALVGSFH
ncbi:MAG: FHIPEP family type III secretion protein [Ramlibacter sp.]